MLQLVYASSESCSFSPADLVALLEKSRANNASRASHAKAACRPKAASNAHRASRAHRACPRGTHSLA